MNLVGKVCSCISWEVSLWNWTRVQWKMVRMSSYDVIRESEKESFSKKMGNLTRWVW
jgi:hypothetical protein